jgi:hypothetical protein
LVKERAATKYRGQALRLLDKLTSSYFSGKRNPPLEGRQIRKKVRTLQAWLGGLSDRQLRRILKHLDEVSYTRSGGYISYSINFESLKQIEPTAEVAKHKIEERNARRAEKARTMRKKNLTRLQTLCAVAIASAVAAGTISPTILLGIELAPDNRDTSTECS